LFDQENTYLSETDSENFSYYFDFNKPSSLTSTSLYPNSTKYSCETDGSSSQVSFEESNESVILLNDISMKNIGPRSQADLEKVIK
jgi:hypothetical protein